MVVMNATPGTIDLITLEVIQQFIIASVREMRATMIKTAHSSIIYEGLDFSCALLDADAQLLGQSESSPAHVIPLPSQVRQAREFFSGVLEPGDVILVNDPYTSGTHLNDVAMIVPFHVDNELTAFVATRAHWGDVGGMYPGSISGRATEIFQEGLRIPFVKVYRGGVPVPGILDLIFANVRGREDREGDFHAMLACCHTAQIRLKELIARFGVATVRAGMRMLLDRSEQRMRAAIARIAPGTYYYEDYLDSDNIGTRPVLVCVAVTVAGSELQIDFAGSSPQVRGPVNCSLAVSATGAFVALKALLDPQGHINQGAFRPVTVSAPEGTVTNAQFPAAVGGFSEMRRRIESLVTGALAAAAPMNVAGDHKGASNHTYISSEASGRRRTTIFYEYPAGGTGGFLEHDGADAMRAWDEGDFSSIQPAEIVEHEHALLIESCELRTDSGGGGVHRGGLGLRRVVRLLANEGTFSELSDRNILQPFGVCGGGAGEPNRFVVLRDGIEIEPSDIPGKVSGFPLRRDDAVVMESAGGGGYADPLERLTSLVARDVREGYVSRRHAEECYGVVIRDDATVDEDATAKARARRRAGRTALTVIAAANDEFIDGRRMCSIAASTLQRLGADEGAAIEFVSLRGAPLRAWIKVSNGIADGCVPLGPKGCAILAVAEGQSVEVRLLQGRRAAAKSSA
ncbi:MAG: hydantoinase B/oxoprolinase family protein [Betaproteobacteria bacterium]|nr:hydantoinase B/oxoprolinase family protein [Betaproteobacteria bacterium]MBI3055031.1 hydantoinase B/oxoprolinase family protein [Betaproteobacteria bacterium]